jgi:hypothetical protein
MLGREKLYTLIEKPPIWASPAGLIMGWLLKEQESGWFLE